MKFNFDKDCHRFGTGCIKWDEDPEGVIPMWVADMDFQTAPCITEAVLKRARQGVFGYTYVRDDYYDAVRTWFGRQHGWNIEKDWIIYTIGVVPAISVCIKAFTKPGDKVLIQTPVYNCFFSSIRNNGCEMIENRLVYKKLSDTEFTFEIDFADFEEKVKEAKLFVLCNPHNPAGRVWRKDELERMAEICRKHNVPVVSDEIHCEIVMPGYTYTPMASLSPEIQENTITLCSPSKAFNIAGLQTANIIVKSTDWKERINKAVNINEVCDINPFGVVALISAYTDAEAKYWLHGLNLYISENNKYVKETLAKELPWMPISKLEGTYLVWCDCRSLGKTSGEIETSLLHSHKVHVNAGSMYGNAGEGFIRLNMACPRTQLEEGLRRIVRGLKEL